MAEIEVTVRDPDTGESQTDRIADDYVITCAGSCYVAHIATHPNGTHVLTVKGRKAEHWRPPAPARAQAAPAEDGEA